MLPIQHFKYTWYFYTFSILCLLLSTCFPLIDDFLHFCFHFWVYSSSHSFRFLPKLITPPFPLSSYNPGACPRFPHCHCMSPLHWVHPYHISSPALLACVASATTSLMIHFLRSSHSSSKEGLMNILNQYIIIIIIIIIIINDCLMDRVDSAFTQQRTWVRFPALPRFKSGLGLEHSTQPCENNWVAA